MQTVPEAPQVIVQTFNWSQIIALIITNLAFILIASAILIAVIKGDLKALTALMNGHFTKAMEMAGNTKELIGKVDTALATRNEGQQPPVRSGRKTDP